MSYEFSFTKHQSSIIIYPLCIINYQLLPVINYEIFGNLRGPSETFGDLREPSGTFGILQKPWKTLENLLETFRNLENLKKPPKTLKNIQKPLKPWGNQGGEGAGGPSGADHRALPLETE